MNVKSGHRTRWQPTKMACAQYTADCRDRESSITGQLSQLWMATNQRRYRWQPKKKRHARSIQQKVPIQSSIDGGSPGGGGYLQNEGELAAKHIDKLAANSNGMPEISGKYSTVD